MLRSPAEPGGRAAAALPGEPLPSSGTRSGHRGLLCRRQPQIGVQGLAVAPGGCGWPGGAGVDEGSWC